MTKPLEERNVTLKLPMIAELHNIGKHWIQYIHDDNDNNSVSHAIWCALHETQALNLEKLQALQDIIDQQADTIASLQNNTKDNVQHSEKKQPNAPRRF